MRSTIIQQIHCSTYLRANAQRPTKLNALVKESISGTVEFVQVIST